MTPGKKIKNNTSLPSFFPDSGNKFASFSLLMPPALLACHFNHRMIVTTCTENYISGLISIPRLLASMGLCRYSIC